MSDIEITPELLAELKAIARKTPPDPWCASLTGSNVEYIRAMKPLVVLALIAEIETLRNNTASIDFSREATGQSLYELYSEAHARAERLEKEADWLASILAKCNSDSDYCLPFCPYHIDKQPAYCDYDGDNAEEAGCSGELPCTHRQQGCWREAARKAVEGAAHE